MFRTTSIATLLGKWWAPVLLSLMVGIGMFVGSPVNSGPDSTVQLATAWVDIHHGGPSSVRLQEHGNGAANEVPCYAFNSEEPDTCTSPQDVTNFFSSTTRITNYPPLFYWIVGLGEIASGSNSGSVAGNWGRLFGLTSCLALVALAAYQLRRVRQFPVLAVYLLLPPIATFIMASTNPSGWEVASALVFSATLLKHWTAIDSAPFSKRSFLEISLTAILFATARPSSPIWLGVLVATFVIWMKPRPNVRTLVRLAFATVPGVALSYIWGISHKSEGDATSLLPPSLGALIHQLGIAFQDIYTKIPQLWGGLGWLDTFPSPLVLLAISLVLLYFIPSYARFPRHRKYLIFVVISVFFISALLEALPMYQLASTSNYGLWWQGRYSLPPVVGMLLLLFTGTQQSFARDIRKLTAFATLGNIYMICENFWRYDTGVTPVGFPRNYIPRNVDLAIVIYLICLLLLVAAVALFQSNTVTSEESCDADPTSELVPSL